MVLAEASSSSDIPADLRAFRSSLALLGRPWRLSARACRARLTADLSRVRNSDVQ